MMVEVKLADQVIYMNMKVKVYERIKDSHLNIIHLRGVAIEMKVLMVEEVDCSCDYGCMETQDEKEKVVGVIQVVVVVVAQSTWRDMKNLTQKQKVLDFQNMHLTIFDWSCSLRVQQIFEKQQRKLEVERLFLRHRCNLRCQHIEMAFISSQCYCYYCYC